MDSTRYFLVCCRYIEWNPVRAWMVAHPGDHARSSWRGHAGERADPLLTPRADYLAPGPDAAPRTTAYRALLRSRCRPSSWATSAVTWRRSARRVRTVSAPGSKRARAGSRPHGRTDGRSGRAIVPATVSLWTPFRRGAEVAGCQTPTADRTLQHTLSRSLSERPRASRRFTAACSAGNGHRRAWQTTRWSVCR